MTPPSNDDGVVSRQHTDGERHTGDTTVTARRVGRTEAALRAVGCREPVLPTPARAANEWEELDRTIEALKGGTPAPAPVYQPHDACLDRGPHGTQPATVVPPSDTWAPLWGILVCLGVGIPWLVGVIAIVQRLRGQS